jgi:DNA-binding Lrp family transcriptional regulator
MIDKKDLKILEALKENARSSTQQTAEKQLYQSRQCIIELKN